MSLKLYNTLTRKKEEFKSLHGKEVGIYTCGPTVYNYAHIGNMRAYIFADILVRYLRYSDYTVKHVMNITDVGHLTSDDDTGEDKVEKEAELERKTAWEIAEKYTNAFFEDSKALNIKKPDVVVKATDLIKEQIGFIKKLEEKGFTYVLNDGVYFDTSKISDYGKLAKLDIEGLRAGERVEIRGKKNKTDFALWKLSPKDKKRDMEWDSPWGKGFPGWHLECSAIGLKYLGEQFDIHTGGIDHINVHHTNEIAQGEALTGKVPAKFWLHSEFLLIDKTRMGKSEGNILRVSRLDKKHGFITKDYEPLSFRLLVLQAHYRDPLSFFEESLHAADGTLQGLRLDSNRLKRIKDNSSEDILGNSLNIAKEGFTDAMNDDLNTAKAFSEVYVLLNKIRRYLPEEKINKKEATEVYKFLMNIDKIFGLDLDKEGEFGQVKNIPENVQELANKREVVRKEKNWGESDRMRAEIEKLGYTVEDTSKGPVIKKN